MVGLAKDWGKDGQRDGVVEDGAEGDSRWLDWWEVCGMLANVGVEFCRL